MLMAVILKIENLSKNFGGLMALSNINMEVESGKIVGIIGPNGAGKTTLFNCLTGLYYPSEGQIVFQDKPIVPKASVKKARLISYLANIYLLFGLLWMPLFWAFFLPMTFFKVELTLLTIFIMFLRYVIIRGLKTFMIWAWSISFVFLTADAWLAIVWLVRSDTVGTFPGTQISLTFLIYPWSGMALVFSAYFLFQLIRKDVRELYGFRLGPDAICKLGIARTFQNIRLFMNLSVLDNIRIGSHILLKSGVFSTVFRTAFQQLEEAETETTALEHLDFVGLKGRFYHLAGMMAYGEQRRVEIARALASDPKILLLDEPAAGMNPQESSNLINLIRKIRDRGVTILIIEHDMKVMMNLADIIYAMDHGEVIAYGVPDEIKNNFKVIEAYLGGSLAHAKID
jgi:branched-chain amino acid transport system ATP-binding protein